MKTENTPNTVKGREKKYEKKLSREQEKKRELFARIGWTAGLIAVIAIFVLLIVRMNANRFDEDYTNYFNDKGLIKGVNASKYITLPDFSKLRLYEGDYAVSEEEIEDEIFDLVTDYMSTLPELPEEDVEFNDDFVKNVLKLDETAEEYRARITKEKNEENFRAAAIELFMLETEISDYPEKLYNSYFNDTDYQYQYTFSYLSSLGATEAANVWEFFEMTYDEYVDMIEETAFERVFSDLLCQHIYLTYKLQPTEAEYQEFLRKVAVENDYDYAANGPSVEDYYGKNMIMKTYIATVAEDFIISHVENVTYADSAVSIDDIFDVEPEEE